MRRAPHRHVERVVLGRVGRVVPVFGGQPQRQVAIRHGRAGGGGTAEIDLAVPLVRGPAVEQPRRQRDHLPDVGVRPRLQGRLADAERGHVTVEVELLDGGEPVVGRAGPVGGGEQHVVHVGHVPADDHLGAAVAQDPGEGVDPDEGRGVTDVGHVVGGDPARVDARPADQRQRRAAQRHRAGQASGLHLIHQRPPAASIRREPRYGIGRRQGPGGLAKITIGRGRRRQERRPRPPRDAPRTACLEADVDLGHLAVVRLHRPLGTQPVRREDAQRP